MKDVFLKTENPCSTRKNVIIFASGNGSNFEAIVEYFRKKGATVDFELICDKENVPVIKRAKRLNIRAFQVNFENLYDFLKKHLKEKNKKGKKVDLFVLAGFMRILPKKILKFGTFVNIHPSLLPKFKGKNAIAQAFQAHCKETGVSVHFVNSKVDSGKIIERRKIATNDLSIRVLEEKIHKIEHKMYPEIIENLLFKKRVMVLGGGAREHAIAEKISRSPFLDKLYLAGANDGFCKLGQKVEYESFSDLANKAGKLKIDLLIVGSENPLCEGITDIFKKNGIGVIGANQDWARLEGSKLFAKKFMKKYDIENADYEAVSDEKKIKNALEKFKNPPVIKADGLALGKGVVVPKSFEEAENCATEMLRGKFGEASKTILLEERLFGREISLFSLWDGKNLVSFPPASDYKRLLDDDNGENTGGMGSYAPSKLNKKEKEELKKYTKKLENALRQEKADFTGVIYSGLILTRGGIKVLEYNMRFGDPEIQSVLELLENDLLDVFLKTKTGKLCDCSLFFKKKTAYCVVAASIGYPSSPKKGFDIEFGEEYGCKIYYAGVKSENNKLKTNGGRVLSVVNSGKHALDKIYKAIEEIKYEGKIYRKDIGKTPKTQL